MISTLPVLRCSFNDEGLQMGHESDNKLERWINREAVAEAMIPLIGTLYRDHQVVTSIHGRRLINKSAIGVLKAHRLSRQEGDHELAVEDTLPVLQALTTLNLGPASIDVASLLELHRESGQELTEFLREELAPVVDAKNGGPARSVDVVLYGFGRIGRLLARILIAHAANGDGLRLRAIVVRKGSAND